MPTDQILWSKQPENHADEQNENENIKTNTANQTSLH
jgi:hypothetical protein